jgi:hypothetical protein
MENITTQRLIEVTLKLKEAFHICTGNPYLDTFRSECFKYMNKGIEELAKRGIKIE